MPGMPPTAIALALLVSSAAPPPTAFAFPILALGSDAPADPTSPSIATPPGSTAARGSGIVLLFEDADIEAVTKAVSEIVGFSYTLAPDVRGKVTIRTRGAIRSEDVFPIFLSVLEVHGFTAVRAGNIYKIVRIETARERAIPTLIDPPRPGAAAEPPAGTSLPPDQVVTQILAPRFAAAAMLTLVLRPLVSSRGSIIAHPPANVLIVTDTAANIAKVAEVVGQLDVELAADELHIFRLHYADAGDVAGILNHIFLGAGLARPPVISADRRTNSLIIRARRSDLEAIGRLLGRD
jgi:general secretion pathway protein D